MTKLEYLLMYQKADLKKQQLENAVRTTESRQKLNKITKLLGSSRPPSSGSRRRRRGRRTPLLSSSPSRRACPTSWSSTILRWKRWKRTTR